MMNKTALLVLTVFLLSLAGNTSASSILKRVAVLPLIPIDGSDPREGWSLAVKMISKMNGNLKIRAVDWTALARVMDQHGLDKKGIRDPKILRRLGKALEVDAVLTGSFRAEGKKAAFRPLLIDIRSGRTSWAKEQRLERDMVVSVPDLKIEPPVLDPENTLAMRDAPSDYDNCEGATGRVDAIEAKILELKARYWALQLSRGVSYSGIKFNPGSTISDPDLKKAFYGRMKAWMAEDVIPELTPHEILQFAEADEHAIHIARSCGIL